MIPISRRGIKKGRNQQIKKTEEEKVKQLNAQSFRPEANQFLRTSVLEVMNQAKEIMDKMDKQTNSSMKLNADVLLHSGASSAKTSDAVDSITLIVCVEGRKEFTVKADPQNKLFLVGKSVPQDYQEQPESRQAMETLRKTLPAQVRDWMNHIGVFRQPG